MSEKENKTCGDKDERKPSRRIVSDVPSGIVEHAKMVHEWAETHPRWKRQHIPDKPKIKNHCGDCAGFRTTFCTWNVDDVQLLPDDDACSLFYPPYYRRAYGKLCSICRKQLAVAVAHDVHSRLPPVRYCADCMDKLPWGFKP